METTKFERKKPHVNIGTIGQVDHGKTTLTAAITMTLAAARWGKSKKDDGIDMEKDDEIDMEKDDEIDMEKDDEIDMEEEEENEENEEKKAPGMKNEYVEYETKSRHYSHVDCPGDPDYVEELVAGAAQMDGAILVVSITGYVYGMKETLEPLFLAQLMGVPKIVVFLNKDDTHHLAELVEPQLREILDECGYPWEDVPIILGSALFALAALIENPKIQRGENRWVDKIYDLMNAVDNYIPTPKRETDKPFLLAIEDVLSSASGETVAIGCVERGTLKLSETVEIVGVKNTATAVCTGLDIFKKPIDEIRAGDIVGIVLSGVEKEDIKKGMVIAKPGTVKAFSKFNCSVLFGTDIKLEVWQRIGISVGDQLQFYCRTTTIMSKLISFTHVERGQPYYNGPEEYFKAILRGDLISMELQLPYPIAIERGMEFGLGGGGIILGNGVIVDIIG